MPVGEFTRDWCIRTVEPWLSEPYGRHTIGSDKQDLITWCFKIKQVNKLGVSGGLHLEFVLVVIEKHRNVILSPPYYRLTVHNTSSNTWIVGGHETSSDNAEIWIIGGWIIRVLLQW